MRSSHIGLHFSDSKISSESFPCKVNTKITLSGESAKLKQKDLLGQLQCYQSLVLNLKYPQQSLPTTSEEFICYLNSSIILQFSVTKANLAQFCSYLDRLFYESGGKQSPNSQICKEISQFIADQTLKVNYLFNPDQNSNDEKFFVIIKSGIFEQQILDAYFEQFSALAAENLSNELYITFQSKLTFRNILEIIRSNQAQKQENKIEGVIEEQKIGTPQTKHASSCSTESLFTAFSRSFSLNVDFLSISPEFFEICCNLLVKLQILSNSSLLSKLEKLDLDLSFNSSEKLPKELKSQIVSLCNQIEMKMTPQKGEEKNYLEIMELVENPWKLIFTHQLLGTIESEFNMPDFLLFFKYFAFKN